MTINDPYVPGDPYSYDLKWIVRELKNLIKRSPVDYSPQLLYDGGKVSSGTVTLDDSLTNYRWICVVCVTSNEFQSYYFPSNMVSSPYPKLICDMSIGNWDAVIGNFQYCATVQVELSTPDSVTVTAFSNDVDYVPGLYRIYGFK